jgi:hypothetical protein
LQSHYKTKLGPSKPAAETRFRAVELKLGQAMTAVKSMFSGESFGVDSFSFGLLLGVLLEIWLGLYLIQYFTRRDSLRQLHANPRAGYPLGLVAGAIQGAMEAKLIVAVL